MLALRVPTRPYQPACPPCLLALARARLRSRTSIIIYLTRTATTRRGGAQFDSIGHRAAANFARPRRGTRARSPIATRLFDVHLRSASAGPPSSSTWRGGQREETLISSTRSTSRRSWHVGVVAHGPAHCARCYAPRSCALSTTAQTAVLASRARWLRASWLPLSHLAGLGPSPVIGIKFALAFSFGTSA